jgi:hypothetical protein
MWHACLTFSGEARLITKDIFSGRRIALETVPKEERPMPIVKITGQGLSAIALSVALLWGCLIAERVAARRAFSERAKVLRDVSRMRRRQRTQPVSAPAPFIPHREHILIER